MKNLNTGIISLIIACISACKDSGIIPESNPATTNQSVTAPGKFSQTVENKILIKVKPEYQELIHLSKTRNGNPTAGIRSIDQLLHTIKAQEIQAVFPVDKRFIKRYKKAGLDRWYVVTLPSDTPPVTRAENQSDFKDIPEIEYAGPVKYPILNGKSDAIPVINTRTAMSPEAIKEAPYNDKLLPLQWHYNNTGEVTGSKKGADINLYAAWKKTTGSPNVIVDIVDGGIDVEHEDLHSNMWTNTAELNGKPGIDDDNNGFTDDIYGWNYLDNTGIIVPHIHGTHVAGTIGAVNNNSIGVGGIAGGDGKPNTGVKLMCTQIFKPGIGGKDQAAEETAFASAIVYGANNGAVISQNSWGVNDPEDRLTDVSPVVKDAIDYFIEYAGCDDEGNQLPQSPMKGGVVIFAAGNDGRDHKAYPASYTKVISVAAMAPNFRLASYSTHGNWITLTAPGGDMTMIPNYIKSEYGVLSTLPGNKYGWLDGTSMACPHVSGIAALILSKYGKQGFTNQKLKEMLVKGTNDIYVENPDQLGKMGVGYIDADKVMSVDGKQPPATISTLTLMSDTSRVKVSWKTVKDPDDGFASWYYIIASEHPIQHIDSQDLKNTNGNLYIQKVRVPRNKTGNMEGSSALLPVGHHFYITVVAEDRWGNVSKPSNILEATVKNGLPIISMKEHPGKIRITGTETDSITFYYNDPDHDKITVSLEGDIQTVTIKNDDHQNSACTLLIGAGNLKAGIHKGLIVVKDSHNGIATHPFSFEVYDNSAPVMTHPNNNIYIGFGETKRILLGQYFKDPDGHRVIYQLTKEGDPAIAHVTMGNGYIDIIGMKKGVTEIRVHVEDTQKGVLDQDMRIIVSNDDLLYNVSPTVTSDFVHLTLNAKLTGLIRITVYNVYGQKITKRIVKAPDTQDVRIDLRSVPRGEYIVKIENQDKEEHINIIKK